MTSSSTHPVAGRVLPDEDCCNEGAPAEVEAADQAEAELGVAETVGQVGVVTVQQEVEALRHPQQPHHREQLPVQTLQNTNFNLIAQPKLPNHHHHHHHVYFPHQK